LIKFGISTKCPILIKIIFFSFLLTLIKIIEKNEQSIILINKDLKEIKAYPVHPENPVILSNFHF